MPTPSMPAASEEGRARPAAGAAIRHPDLHGCAARSGEICRARRRRRACHPQRRRAGQRRCHPLAGHLAQVARHRPNGSSSITPIAAWSSSPTRSCADLLAGSLEDRHLGEAAGPTGTGPRLGRGRYIGWLTIKEQAESVAEDVRRIRSHPLVPRGIPIYGYIYDVRRGRLIEVPEATRIGKAA